MTVDVGARVVTCRFLNGPVTSATCTIQYGSDPTYVNLPNTDSSTGTDVVSVTVSLSAPFQADTLYYYLVSSMGVQMQGSFRSGREANYWEASVSNHIRFSNIHRDVDVF